VRPEGPAGQWGTQAGGAAISVDAANGGRLTSLTVGGLEILGSTTPRPGAPPEIFYGCFVMAPFVGRTAHGRFSFGGREWNLPLNFGPHAIHGFVFDRPWETAGHTMQIELDERWPFGGTVTQHFQLTPHSLTIAVRIENEHRSMPAITGFHPWFRREVGAVPDPQIDFRPDTSYVCDDSGIPTHSTPGTLARPWDDSFTDVQAAPQIHWGGALQVQIASAGRFWIVCETLPDAFCVEPLSGPVNGLNTAAATIVEPGAPLLHDMTISWTKPS
jgi:aldose 1-epimerase